MAKKLSAKVEHCPSCGVLKSKFKQCKRCGYIGQTQEEKPVVSSINLKLTGYDMSKYNKVIINGIEFHK